MQVTVVHQVVWVVVVLAWFGVCSGFLIGGVVLLKAVVADPARAINTRDFVSQVLRYVPGAALIAMSACGLRWVFEAMIQHLTLP